MKANCGKGNSPKRDRWITPDWIFKPLHRQYNFCFDCCADSENKKCNAYSDDFESIDIIDQVSWMNPPFSIAWKMFEHFFRVVQKGVAIYRCDNFETGIWQKIIFHHADWVLIPNRRVNYEGLDGEGSRFPSALIGIGINPPKNIDGIILEVTSRNSSRP